MQIETMVNLCKSLKLGDLNTLLLVAARVSLEKSGTDDTALSFGFCATPAEGGAYEPHDICCWFGRSEAGAYVEQVHHQHTKRLMGEGGLSFEKKYDFTKPPEPDLHSEREERHGS